MNTQKRGFYAHTAIYLGTGPGKYIFISKVAVSTALGTAAIWGGTKWAERHHEAKQNALNRQATAAKNALNRQATAAENAANREQELNKLKLKYAAKAAQRAPEAPKDDKNRWFR
jgi:uncharacterized protein YdgA (DUF945 family)